MKFIIILIVAAVAFVGGWYANERGIALPFMPSAPAQVPQAQHNPTSTPAPTATYHNADANMIIVDAPTPGASVGKTFAVSGRARGNWYFEATFSVDVVSSTGTRLVRSPVQAQGAWMTTEFVPFSTTIAIPGAYEGPATVVLRNDNASGLPENDKSVSIPIVIQ